MWRLNAIQPFRHLLSVLRPGDGTHTLVHGSTHWLIAEPRRQAQRVCGGRCCVRLAYASCGSISTGMHPAYLILHICTFRAS